MPRGVCVTPPPAAAPCFRSLLPPAGSGVSHIRLLVADLQEATRDGDLKWDSSTLGCPM